MKDDARIATKAFDPNERAEGVAHGGEHTATPRSLDRRQSGPPQVASEGFQRSGSLLAGLAVLGSLAGCLHNPSYLPENFVPSPPPGRDIGVFARAVGPAPLLLSGAAPEEELRELTSELNKAIVAQLNAKGYRAKPILRKLLPDKPPAYQARFSPPFYKEEFEQLKASLADILPQEGVSSVLVFNFQVFRYTNYRSKSGEGYPFLNTNHLTEHSWLHVLDANGKLLVAEAIERSIFARIIVGSHQDKPAFLPVVIETGRGPGSPLTIPGWAEMVARIVVSRVPPPPN